MKHFFTLTSIAFFCCFACAAQQKIDTTDPLADTQRAGASGIDSVFADFSALVKESNKVSLQWNVDHAAEGQYFIVERATEGSQYETIGAIRKEGYSNHYELTDIAPPNGTDLYRIRYTAEDGRMVYSRTAQVSLSSVVDFSFYPNPVDKLLIVRAAHPVDMQVVDVNGATRLSMRLPAGIQVINISSLTKGMYVLRVADKESNRIISKQLEKN